MYFEQVKKNLLCVFAAAVPGQLVRVWGGGEAVQQSALAMLKLNYSNQIDLHLLHFRHHGAQLQQEFYGQIGFLLFEGMAAQSWPRL